MRGLYHGLLILSLFLGLGFRVFGADPCQLLIQQHAMMHADHDHDHDKPCDPAHEENCPMSHQGTCHHGMPVMDVTLLPIKVGNLGFSLSLVSADVLVVPEEPVDEMDKPPLIAAVPA